MLFTNPEMLGSCRISQSWDRTNRIGRARHNQVAAQAWIYASEGIFATEQIRTKLENMERSTSGLKGLGFST